jgi:hypothetical protein
MLFLIIYVFSSTKLEKSAEQVLPGSKGHRGEREGVGYGGEMTQTMYAHMNIEEKIEQISYGFTNNRFF